MHTKLSRNSERKKKYLENIGDYKRIILKLIKKKRNEEDEYVF
jgi:hypothetical protein